MKFNIKNVKKKHKKENSNFNSILDSKQFLFRNRKQ